MFVKIDGKLLSFFALAFNMLHEKMIFAIHEYNFYLTQRSHQSVFSLLLQAESRADFAERTVSKLQKEVDQLESKLLYFLHHIR